MSKWERGRGKDPRARGGDGMANLILCLCCGLGLDYILVQQQPMINRLTMQAQVCKTHHLPETLICLDPKCQSSALLCPHCAKHQHPHLDHIISLEDFQLHFQHALASARQKYKEDQYPLSVPALIRSKKQEVERSQVELLELMMRRLGEEKKRMFEALDAIERAFSDREQYFSKHKQARTEVINYLSPFAHNPQLFELKMLVASSWGVSRLKENLLELDRLSGVFSRKDLVSLEQMITREINLSLDLSFFRTAKQCFKETVKPQPLLFVPHPPLKKYSFKSRQSPGTVSTRPTSCGESKGRSLECLRPMQARSQIML